MLDRLTPYLPDWIAAHPRRWAVVGAIVLVAAGYAWMRGGFRAVPPAPLAVYGLDRTITTNEWTLRPLRAWIAERGPAGSRAPAGGAVLVVEVWAENRTNRSSTSVAQALRLIGAREGADTEDDDEDPLRSTRTPGLILLRDPSFGGLVHPGLPENLALTWDLTPAQVAAHTTEARIVVFGREWVERDSLVGGSGWLRDRPVGTLTVRVEDRRTPAAPPASASAPVASASPPPSGAPAASALRVAAPAPPRAGAAARLGAAARPVAAASPPPKPAARAGGRP